VRTVGAIAIVIFGLECSGLNNVVPIFAICYHVTILLDCRVIH
jgi:hypothetical protein